MARDGVFFCPTRQGSSLRCFTVLGEARCVLKITFLGRETGSNPILHLSRGKEVAKGWEPSSLPLSMLLWQPNCVLFQGKSEVAELRIKALGSVPMRRLKSCILICCCFKGITV